MPLTSPISRLPYPVLSDPANIETAVKPLVEAIDAKMVPAAAESPSVRLLGIEARAACSGNDGRLFNERTPTNESVTQAKIAAGAAGTAAEAFRVANAINAINAVGSVILFQAKSFDVSNRYTTVNGRYTPLSRGIYRVSALAFPASLGVGRSFAVTLLKNGAPYCRLSYGIGTGSAKPGEITGAGGLVEMNGSTDFLQIQVEHAEERALSPGEEAWFCGELVGKT